MLPLLTFIIVFGYHMLLFAGAMALAGFLLFQVQPVMAKFILPWFGGSATT